MKENKIASIIVDSAYRIHKTLGPGLFESVYETVLSHELSQQNLAVDRQVPIPIEYNGIRFEEGFRADLVVEDLVIIELKSLESVSDVHKKQLLTYLRLAGIKLGLLLNFGAPLMRDGITRIVNGLPEDG